MKLALLRDRVVSQAVVVAFGVAADGRREVLDFEVCDRENEGFWTGFLRLMYARGLDGVTLAISDAYSGPKKAIGLAFSGCFPTAVPGAFHAQRALDCAQGILGPLARSSAPPSPKPAPNTCTPSSTTPGKTCTRSAVSPNPAALLRLAGAVLVEQHDEWETRDRGYHSEAGVTELKTMNTTKLDPVEEGILVPELAGAWSKH